jgi:hypothetical protein
MESTGEERGSGRLIFRGKEEDEREDHIPSQSKK